MKSNYQRQIKVTNKHFLRVFLQLREQAEDKYSIIHTQIYNNVRIQKS